MRRRGLALGALLMLVFFACGFAAVPADAAAAPDIEWEQHIDRPEEEFSWDDDLSFIQQTSDGGYISIGSTGMGNVGESYELCVIKQKASGEVEWQKYPGGAGSCIRQTNDGGYIVVGGIEVIKLDASGNTAWRKSLGGTGGGSGNSIQQTNDGGYIVTGSTNSNDGNHGGGDIWVAKLNASGEITWQKCLGGTGSDSGSSIQQTNDGGYVVTGSTNSNDGNVSGNHGGGDIWVAKLNASGELAWQKCLGGTGAEMGGSIQQTSDGGYIVTGSTNSNNGNVSGNHGDTDIWTVKLGASGEIAWQKCLGGTDGDYGYSIQQTNDGGYIVAGSTDSKDGNVSGNLGETDIWVVKLNTSGELVWQKCLGEFGFDGGGSVQQTADGGYIVAGGGMNYHGWRDGDAEIDGWIFKLAPERGTVPPYNTSSNESSVKASTLIKVEPGEGVAIRTQPSAKGKIVAEGANGIRGNTAIYVEPQPINSGGTSWYKAHFMDEALFALRQVKYIRYFTRWNSGGSYVVSLDNAQYLYVNAKEARKVSINEREKDFFAQFDKGRPPRFKVGDSVTEVKKFSLPQYGGYRSAKTRVPLKLYSEPRRDARTSTLPQGTAIVDLVGAAFYLGDGWATESNEYLEPMLGYHADMQDHFWCAIIDAKSLKVIGWIDSDEYEFRGDQIILPPPSESDLDEKNIGKVFIY